MTDTPTMSTADRIAMLVGGGLIVLGTVVLGTLEAVIGNPHAMPVTNDAGQVVATTTFPVDVRATIVLLGLVVWLLYALYRFAMPMWGSGSRTPSGVTTE